MGENAKDTTVKKSKKPPGNWWTMMMALAAAGTFSALIYSGKDLLVEYWDHQSESTNFVEALVNIGAVHDVLDNLRANVNADRCVVLFAHDSGSIPTTTSPLFSSVLYDSRSNNAKGELADWQTQLLDKVYVDMLIDLYSKNHIVVITEDMKEGILKDTYQSIGITHAEIHKIYVTESKFIYLSVTWSDEDDRPPVFQYNDYSRKALGKLQRLIKKQIAQGIIPETGLDMDL